MSIREHLDRLAHLLGVERRAMSHREKLISAAGGVAGIPLVFPASRRCPGGGAVLPVAASMGASAVLPAGAAPFNRVFPWRRYPANLARLRARPAVPGTR
jgi:CBS-domain-containing membrane protein